VRQDVLHPAAVRAVGGGRHAQHTQLWVHGLELADKSGVSVRRVGGVSLVDDQQGHRTGGEQDSQPGLSQ
jgi:hypothetical protein